MAIADQACGSWPALARKAACDLTGVEDDGALNVTLLTDVRTAFRVDDVMRSVDLLAALVADPEAPWGDTTEASPSPCANWPSYSGSSGSSPRPYTRQGCPTVRGTRGPILSPGGRLIALLILVIRPWPSFRRNNKRAKVQVPVKWAQLMIFQACANPLPHGSKNPTYL